MPARDGCEPQMIRAFENDGWTIRRRGFTLFFEGIGPLFADLQIAKDDTIVVIVEIKCFPPSGTITDEVQRAIGQCAMYRKALDDADLPYSVALAVPAFAYRQKINSESMRYILSINRTELFVINLEIEEIVQWIR